jgi:hypothetical protein
VIVVHRKKKVREFPVPSRDVTTKLSLGGNNDVITELFLPRESLVIDIPAGDGKLVNLFLRCIIEKRTSFATKLYLKKLRNNTFMLRGRFASPKRVRRTAGAAFW